jgi:hypothetical protein
MPDEQLPLRSLRMSALLATAFSILLYFEGYGRFAFGILAGTALGMLSLGTLMWTVPRLFKPGKKRTKVLMGIVSLLKLPLCLIGVYLAIRPESAPYINPFGVFCGVALVPAVIFLKVVGWQMANGLNK